MTQGLEWRTMNTGGRPALIVTIEASIRYKPGFAVHIGLTLTLTRRKSVCVVC